MHLPMLSICVLSGAGRGSRPLRQGFSKRRRDSSSGGSRATRGRGGPGGHNGDPEIEVMVERVPEGNMKDFDLRVEDDQKEESISLSRACV